MYKHISLVIQIYLIFFSLTIAQTSDDDVNSVLDYTLSYRGLTREDITIPIDFFSAAEKSPTNDSKLLLPLVRDMMINPLRSITWLDSTDQYLSNNVRLVSSLLFTNLLSEPIGAMYSEYYIPQETSEFGEFVVELIKKSTRLNDSAFKKITKDDFKFLSRNLLSILEESENDDPVNFDIFKYNKGRDSSIQVSRKTMDILSKINMKWLSVKSMTNFSDCEDLCTYVLGTVRKHFLKLKNYNIENIKGEAYYYYDDDGIRIVIGGPGKNIYAGRFDFIIDMGGNDIYDLDNDDKQLLSNKEIGRCQCIIDYSGNDYYSTRSNFALAGALFSSSFIFDKEGDDVYSCQSVGLGAAIGGLGLLYDENGNDTYHGVSFSIGAGCFGIGLLVDRKGNDTYIANSYSQGFGMTEGVGAIIDNEGNDSYLVDARSLDIGRYNDHYVSMCQGYGLGLRPYYAGGIGLIIEGAGNDVYNTDIFGQGGAYWYSLGAIIDKSGHDKYNGYQYSQGAGIHLAVGLLKDYDGWDFYGSQGVSQGCGHDFGFGFLWDVKGNDNYSAYSLSQGAGNADGIGILIDESGSDGYLSKEPVYMSRGYGNPRREYGSIGVFLDMSGKDFYSTSGLDSTVSGSSTWGVMNDYFLTDLPEQSSGDDFKVALDTSRTREQLAPLPFTIADYFIMAKTIEPRFSLWQELGFNKLVSDSVNTADFVLTKLGTDDHRETQVMRVLTRRMGEALNNAVVNRLKDYSSGKTAMDQNEVSFACYLIGETGYPSGKEILLQLSHDSNYKIRSSAINALGKIKFETDDTEFKNKVSKRLIELVNENIDKKLYNKDIAFAFSKYQEKENLDALLSLLKNNFYGARFLAADALKQYWNQFGVPDNNTLLNLESGKPAFQAFLYSLVDLPDDKFKALIGQILNLPIASDEIVNLNLIDLLRIRESKVSDATELVYYGQLISSLESKSKLKVK